MFDKADITRDGTISIAEYMALCNEYGVQLDEEDIKAVKDIADNDGEVNYTFEFKTKHVERCLIAKTSYLN